MTAEMPEKGFLNTVFTGARLGLAEGLKFQALQAKTAALAFNTAGSFIPVIGTVKGQALGTVFNKVGDGFSHVIHKLEDGHRDERRPDAMGYLIGKVDQAQEYMHPGRVAAAVGQINQAGDTLNKVAPSLNIKPVKPFA